MLDLADKVFKKVFIYKLNKLKGSISKQQKKCMMTMAQQIENFNKKIKIIKRTQKETLESKIIIYELKHFTRDLKSRFEMDEGKKIVTLKINQ